MARKNKAIYAIDCETDPFFYGRTPKPFAWGLYSDDDYQCFWGDDCTDQLMEFIQDMEDCIFYAHNGGKFDFFFLLKYLDPDLFIINGRIARATLNNKQIELRDSWLILPLPLASHGKTDIDYRKMEREKREKNRAEILAYLHDDCRSLHEWVMAFRNQFGGGLTLAGTAFKQLKLTDYPIEKTNKTFDERFRDFYFGGRVQCFKVGAFIQPLKYVDINSAYPYAMTFKHWQGSGYRETFRLPEGDNGSWFAVIDAVSRGALPMCATVGHQTKLYFPDDGLCRRYHACGWEILAGLETSTLEIVKIHRVYLPTFKLTFESYVNKFFTMKREAEKAGDKTMRGLAKLLLNSAYGKFAQDGRDFEKFCILDFGDVPDKYAEKKRDENGEIVYTQWDHYADTESGQSIFSRPDPVDYFYNVATAASITGFVRASLWRAICQADGVLYCDTDSIICTTFAGVMGDGLGEWSLEADITEAYIAQRKMYALKTIDDKHKIASKGVRLTFEQIRDGVLTGTNLVYEKDAPAFSLNYGARFFDRTIDFKNIDKNACNNPPHVDNAKTGSY